MYPILNLTRKNESGHEELKGLGQEPLGSKRKFWGLLEDQPESPWLFKFARVGTGENWSEKIASELASIIELPSAKVELANFEGEPGALVRSIIPHDFDPIMRIPIRRGDLIHGNEILAGRIPEYNKGLQWGQMDHTWDNIVSGLNESLSIEEMNDSFVRLAGMVVLDAWIGNTDRHHENWALLSKPDGHKSLAPSYDHASSLGRELKDEKRIQIIAEGRLEQYILKGRGAIYGHTRGRHADNPLNFAYWAAARHPDWFRPWISRLKTINNSRIAEIVHQVSPEIMTATCKDFTIAFLNFTKDSIIKIET